MRKRQKTKKQKKGFQVNQKYKDTFFRFLFGKDKTRALELYNAVNGTNYTDTTDFEINTLDDFIYMKMKNDVSYLFARELSLFEHQSTVNPNMPLRGLMYFSDQYHKLYGNNPRIYGQTILPIPLPRYYVMYNGNMGQWKEERIKLRLSDMFEKPLPEDEQGDFEWTATVINLNHGMNEDLKNRSSILHGYCQFVDLVKQNRKSMDTEHAVDAAVQECINRGILADILRKHESEVKGMCFKEFDEVAYTEMVRDESKLLTLIELVNKGKITLEDAAEEVNMNVTDFQARMNDVSNFTVV